MSTQSRKLFYLSLSLLLHLAVGIVLLFPPSAGLMSQKEEREPLFVDVVELPPQVRPTKEKPPKPSAYSDRTVKVEKEEVPDERPLPVKKKKKKVASLPRKGTEGIKKPEKIEEKKPTVERKKEVERPRPRELIPVEDTPRQRRVVKERPTVPQEPEEKIEGPVALFPTEKRLRELTEKYRKAPPKREKGKVLSLNTSELKYSRYLLDMKRRIEFYWEYPLSSVRNGEQGRLLIDFVITKDGSIRDIKIVKSSNYPALDDAAVTAIRLASPFNPFPPDFTIEEVRVHASFEYQLIFTRYR